jgi:hypothetical protein
MVAQLLAVRIWHWLAKYCFAIANFFAYDTLPPCVHNLYILLLFSGLLAFSINRS